MKGENEDTMKRFLFALFACLVLSTVGTASASANDFNSLYNTAKSYMGVPYKWGGTTAAGFDCSGYTQFVFKKNNISIPRTTGSQYSTGKAVAKSNLQPGDLVFFNTSGRGVSHVGIFVGNNNFIHASTSKGVMVSSIYDPYYWGSRYIGAKRVKDFSTQQAKPATPKPEPVKPDPSIHANRAEVAVLLTEELGLVSVSNTVNFTDVTSNHPHIDAIAAVAEAGIFSGNNDQFNPDGYLTRAELAVVLVEAFNLTGGTNANFTDVPENHWAKKYVNILYYNKVTTGYGNGLFGANDYVTKDQLKSFIDRLNK